MLVVFEFRVLDEKNDYSSERFSQHKQKFNMPSQVSKPKKVEG